MQSLYIHIPFCHSKCVYCDFYSVAGMRGASAVVDGLLSELDFRKDEAGPPFDTIYLGGGTPSALPISDFARLMAALPVEGAVEVTMEVNPEDVSVATAKVWKSSGINRISMGVQTFDSGVLRRIGRRHSGDDAVRAVDVLHDAGFGNVSVDLIYGLPYASPGSWEADLRRAFALGITHLSAYSLTYTEGTMLWKLKNAGKVAPVSDEDAAMRFEELRRIAAESGFEHYEISNLAKPGFRSKHNSGYWTPGHRWLGIGPSAHSFDGRCRRVDHPSVREWLAALPYPCLKEEETPVDLSNDMLVACLRTLDGLPLGCLEPEVEAYVRRRSARFVENGAMAIVDGRLKISPDQWLRSDYYIRQLIYG